MVAGYCPKEHAPYRETLRAPDGTLVFAGIRLTFCRRCEALWPVRVNPDAPHPRSIREYAPLIKAELVKLNVDPMKWPYVKSLIAKRKSELISRVQLKARELYHKVPDFRTIERVLEFCAEAGEKAALVVDGVIRKIREDGDSYVLYPDPYGIDPPLMELHFNCPTCCSVYSADDMVEYELYYCPRCLTWLVYDGFEVRATVPTGGYTHVEGSIVDKVTGAPLTNVRVGIKMRTCETDRFGRFRLSFVPIGEYQLKVLVDGRQLEVPVNANDNFKFMTLALADDVT